MSLKIDKEYLMQWNNHTKIVIPQFEELRKKNLFVDVTLLADGYEIGAHRLVLAASSTYFNQYFTKTAEKPQSLIFLKDVSHKTLKQIIEFIYTGAVKIRSDEINAFFSTANVLKIKGLNDDEHLQPVQPTTDGLVKRKKFSSLSCGSNCKDFEIMNFSQETVENAFNDTTDVTNMDENEVNSEPVKTHQQSVKQFQSSPQHKLEYIETDVDELFHINDDTDHCLNQSSKVQRKTNIGKTVETYKHPIHVSGAAAYKIVAEFRTSVQGKELLYYNGFTFGKKNINPHSIHWTCSKRFSQKCKASASTKKFNGKIMMKITRGEHTHDPDILF